MPGTKSEGEILPLDKQERTYSNPRTRAVESVPALDPRWVEELLFVKYSAPPFTLSLTNEKLSYDVRDQGEVEEWKERMMFLEEDLKYLLCLPHSNFWCQVIFDESLSTCLDSYLHHAPRSFDVWHSLPPDLLELEQKVHKLVFMVYLRISTHRESKEHFFTPDTFGEILYENFLFDIPKILDICALYSNMENNNLLIKMMENVFLKQPKYLDDLDNTVPSINEMLDNVQAKCGFFPNDHADSKPQRLSESKFRGNSSEDIVDVVLYLTDTSFTLHSIMTIIPSACQVFHKHDFFAKLASLVETVFPWLEKKVKQTKLKVLKKKLKLAKDNLVMVCQCILRTCVLEPLHRSSTNKSPEDLQPHADEFFHILISVLSEKRFLSAYNKVHNIETEIDITRTAGVYIDTVQAQFVLSAVESACKAFPIEQRKPKQKKETQEPQAHSSNSTASLTAEVNNQASTSQESGAVGGLGDVEIESMITHIKELFSELGDGFIMECLEHLDFNMEHLINLLLEGNLPPELLKLDMSMPRKEKKPTLLDERLSVFDRDEFDVFSNRRIDTSRVQIGKRHETRLDFQRVLDDRSDDMKLVQDRFCHDEYDDEYDDTYDTQNVGAQDADSADELDELTIRRPFTTPRVLGGSPSPSDDDDEEEDDGNDAQGVPGRQERGPASYGNRQNGGTKQGFSGRNQEYSGQGPRWQGSGQGRGGNSRGGGRGGGGQSRGGQGGGGQSRGGQGGPSHGSGGGRGGQGGGSRGGGSRGGGGRGGGTSDRTAKDRANKDKNKSSRANHNRKAMADKKRNKGMGSLPPQ